MVNRIEEKRGSYTYTGKKGATAPAHREKTLAEIMRNKHREANSARRSAQETQEFLKWALQNCKNQEDLDAIRDLVNTHGSAKQRKLFEKMEHDFAPGLTNSQRRKELAARSTDKKFTQNENFRQAILNAESVDDLKTLEKEYGKKLPQSLRTTYNSRLQALEKAAKEAETLHAENQSFYQKLFGYGNGKHPSVTPLGTAEPTSSKGMNWEKYTAEHGLKYTKPEVSGVVKAGLLAEEAIARNAKHNEMQAVYEELFKNIDEPKPPVTEAPIDRPPVAEPPIDRPPVNEPPINKPPKPKFKLGKKGKFALLALGLGILGTGIAYFVNKNKKAAPADTQTVLPADTTAAKGKDTIPTIPAITEPIDTIEAKVVSEIPRDKETGKYIVRKGDNCWNIAKAELIKEKGGEIPTDEEVLKRTYKILERNDLNF